MYFRKFQYVSESGISSYPRDESMQNVNKHQQGHNEAQWDTRWIEEHAIPEDN